MTKLFQLTDGGEIKPTESCFAIGYLRDIIDEYATNSGKIFYYLHCMWSMNPEDNPFYNLPESEKQEVIVRNVCPEIDIDAPLIQEALELVGKLYETPNYRLYKSLIKIKDKLATELYYVHISLNKEDGNSKEIENALKLETTVNERTKVTYKEMMEEMGVTEARGGRSRNKYSGGNSELE